PAAAAAELLGSRGVPRHQLGIEPTAPARHRPHRIDGIRSRALVVPAQQYAVVWIGTGAGETKELLWTARPLRGCPARGFQNLVLRELFPGDAGGFARTIQELHQRYLAREPIHPHAVADPVAVQAAAGADHQLVDLSGLELPGKPRHGVRRLDRSLGDELEEMGRVCERATRRSVSGGDRHDALAGLGDVIAAADVREVALELV